MVPNFVIWILDFVFRIFSFSCALADNERLNILIFNTPPPLPLLNGWVVNWLTLHASFESEDPMFQFISDHLFHVYLMVQVLPG